MVDPQSSCCCCCAIDGDVVFLTVATIGDVVVVGSGSTRTRGGGGVSRGFSSVPVVNCWRDTKDSSSS
jgi:hypothetical protein